MLKELTLYGEVDKVQVAINRLRLHEPPEGYYVAFSGGKDSCVVLDLCKRAGVKYDAHYNITTVDPPELTQFIRREYPEAWEGRNIPEINMHDLIIEKRMPPTRRARYCCQVFKEQGGKGRVVVTGVRHAESAKRAKRQMMETCNQHRDKRYLHPIIDWKDEDVWEYIKTYNVSYCKLYDEGKKRLGCIMCPYQGGKGMRRDAERWPQFRSYYIDAFQKMIDKRRADGLTTTWTTGAEVMRWWMGEDNRIQEDDDQITLFGMRMDESNV